LIVLTVSLPVSRHLILKVSEEFTPALIAAFRKKLAKCSVFASQKTLNLLSVEMISSLVAIVLFLS
jgi:hypothetical protein